MRPWLVFGIALALGGPVASAAADPAAPKAGVTSRPKTAPKASTTARTAEEIQSDTPPASTYDLVPEKERTSPMPAAGMLTHLWRTVLALAAVVALILLFGRVLLPKVAGRLHRGQGQRLKVVERVSIDNRNALMVVELAEGQQVLLSSGEGGLRMMCPMPVAKKATFTDSLRDAPKRNEVDPPALLTAQGQKERDARAS